MDDLGQFSTLSVHFCVQHLLCEAARHAGATAIADICPVFATYIYGDSVVNLMLAGFRRHLVGKTLIDVFHCDVAEIRFVGKLMIIQTFS